MSTLNNKTAEQHVTLRCLICCVNWRLTEMHVICLALQKDPSEQSELQYDEFGFRMDTEGNVFTHTDTRTHMPFSSVLTPLFSTPVKFLNHSQETNGNVDIWAQWLHYVYISECSFTISFSCWWGKNMFCTTLNSSSILSAYLIVCLIVNLCITNGQQLRVQCVSPIKEALFLALLFNHLSLIQTLFPSLTS